MNMLSSHVMMIVLTVVLVIMMIFGIKMLNDQWSGFVEDSQKENICMDLKKAVMDIYQLDVLDRDVASVRQIALPDRLAGRSYSISSRNQTFEIVGYGNLSYCDVGVPVLLTGHADGGNVKLSYQKIDDKGVVSIEEYS